MTTYWLLGEIQTHQNDNHNVEQQHQIRSSASNANFSSSQVTTIVTTNNSRHQNSVNENGSAITSATLTTTRNLENLAISGNNGAHNHQTVNPISPSRQAVSTNNESLPNHSEGGPSTPLLVPISSIP